MGFGALEDAAVRRFIEINDLVFAITECESEVGKHGGDAGDASLGLFGGELGDFGGIDLWGDL